MPRPKSPHPKVKLHIALPEETVGRIMLRIAGGNSVYGFPQGALSKFIELAVNEKLDRLTES